MSRLIAGLGVFCLVCSASGLAAVEPCFDPVGPVLECTRAAAVVCACPDDYCRKPLPCVPCRVRVATDDYCPKPLPCLTCLCLPRCPDDYCRPPSPKFCWPVAKCYYRCPPGSDADVASMGSGQPAAGSGRATE